MERNNTSGKGMNILILVIVLSTIFVFAAFSHAALSDRGVDVLGNHLFYDTDLNITWYDFTKSINTWYNQNSWAQNLTVTLTDGRSFSDWRLPTTPTTGWFWRNEDEMAHLFYDELGNIGLLDENGGYQSGWGLKNTGPFKNLVADWYWSGADYMNYSNKAWLFSFDQGYTTNYLKSTNNYAIAVLTGDVGASVPVPPSVWLLGAGLVGLVGLRRRFTK